MKKILLLLVFLQFSLFASIGKITATQGEVYIIKGTSKTVAKSGSPLEEKDTIKTGDNSKALVLFNDKTTISIGKNSDFSIESFLYDEKVVDNNKAKFKFNVGVFRTISGAIGKLNKSKFKIETKSASIGIRGTVFLVEVKQNMLRVGVEHGGVVMIPYDKNIQKVNINKNEVLTYDDKTKQIKIMPLSEWKEAQKLKQDSEEMGNKNDLGNKDDGSDKLENVDIDKFKEELVTAFKNWSYPDNKLDKSPSVSNEDKNNAPTISSDGTLTVNKNTKGTIQVTGSDIDGDTLTYSIRYSPLNGTATIDPSTGLVTYIPTDNFYGIDTITVEVTDDQGLSSTKRITVIVDNELNSNNVSADLSDQVTEGIKEISGELSPVDNLGSTEIGEFGFITNGSTTSAAYVTGSVTPMEVIQSYINDGKKATYNGGIAALIDGKQVTTGSVSLKMDFGNQSFNGTLNVDPSGGNWNANINSDSGSVNPLGFSSSNISGSSNYGTINSGSIKGRFYGTDASAVGGTFQLSSDKSINGVFGGTRNGFDQ